ncbi:transport and Golgi organization protein 6 homolog isoform X2 [Adelges cooleyi]|uniref:transport and Golgi organization protein 6 homolog isoform X2 n=1 Tax=Adelges cooleyi TaxID=133065 RepID=UPI00217F3860|nr:transport and Golgi organization protein 6 homolog isoform X2 [Adelges cooleyi]
MEVRTIINLMSNMTSTNCSDGILKVIENNLNKVLSIDPTLGSHNKDKEQSKRFCYVSVNIDLLFRLKDCLRNSQTNDTEILLSVTQCTTVTKCIDYVVGLGLIPCFVPALWAPFRSTRETVIKFTEDIPSNIKYDELNYVMNAFVDLLKEPTLNRLILATQAKALFAGLCQLCWLPIAKPGTKIAIENSINELKYEQLIKDQNYYKNIFKQLILQDHNPLMIREMIFIIGQKDCQKHLRIRLGEVFGDMFSQQNGIKTLLGVACDLISAEPTHNFYQHGLHEWSNLLHSYFTKSKSKYVSSIVPQIWQLLRTKTKLHEKYFQSIAVYCMHLMYEEDCNEFFTHYMNPMVDQLKNKNKINVENHSVSQCISDLHISFFKFKDKMWSLSPKLLTTVAGTIYNIYITTATSVYYQKSLLEDLVYFILVHFSDNRDVLKLIIFSQYRISVIYNDCDGDIAVKHEIREHQLYLENEIDMVLNLMERKNDLALMKTMFTTFLDMYADSMSNEYSVMERLVIVKSIQYLIEKDEVQQSISKDPSMVLNLIQSLLKNCSEEETFDVQVLSITLMILGSILEKNNKQIIGSLSGYTEYLVKIANVMEDGILKDMVLETKQKIQNNYSKKSENEKRSIDDILFNTRDPLLPCRAHALIELKKLVESRDKDVLAKKSTILVVVQENLKNADSYLYLSAIFTLSSLCTFCPNDILPILCEEYCMPDNYNHSAETRLKIGEVLMKTVRLLNETIPLYKNRLLNTFMAGVRDNDHLVRASSLSNLADLCRLLRYNLGSIVSEVVSCADYILRFDPANEPRRAAVLLLQLIIEGADTELLEILGSSIKEIYNMLKFHYSHDKDETVQLHAEIAIEKLNKIMKSLFLNKVDTKKNI